MGLWLCVFVCMYERVRMREGRVRSFIREIEWVVVIDRVCVDKYEILSK